MCFIFAVALSQPPLPSPFAPWCRLTLSLFSSQESTTSPRSNRHCFSIARLKRSEDKTTALTAFVLCPPLLPTILCLLNCTCSYPVSVEWNTRDHQRSGAEGEGSFQTPHTRRDERSQRQQLPVWVLGLAHSWTSNSACTVFSFPQSRKTNGTRGARSSTHSQHSSPQTRGGRHSSCR